MQIESRLKKLKYNMQKQCKKGNIKWKRKKNWTEDNMNEFLI